jgi:hypothetical protein
MKTIIDLPEPLLATVKRLAEHEQRDVDEMVAELVRVGIERWSALQTPGVPQSTGEQWLVEWMRLGEETLQDAPPGPTGTEILAAGRNRLEQND